MPNNQRSKRKSKTIEPITFDELRDAAGMSGFVSFLNLPTTEVISAPVDTAPVVAAPVDAAGPACAGADSSGVVPAQVVSTPVDSSTTRAVLAPVDLRPPFQGISADDISTAPVSGTGASPARVVAAPVDPGSNATSVHPATSAELLPTTPVKPAGVAPSRVSTTPVDMTLATQLTGVIPTGVVSSPVDRTPGSTPADPGTSTRPSVTPLVVSTPVGMAKSSDAERNATMLAVPTPASSSPAVLAPVVFARPNSDRVVYAPLRGGKNLYRCFSAQDGHSHLEEALYQLLWRAGTPISPEVRIAQVSQSDLARHLRITEKNLRIALQRLVEKLSIEIIAGPDFALKTAKQYRTYSECAILQRRREAGLEWVIRNKGIQFVSKENTDKYREATTTPVDMETSRVDV